MYGRVPPSFFGTMTRDEKTFDRFSIYISHNGFIYNNFIFRCIRLALYVYEYLLHVGAQKAAQTFLSEVNIFYITHIESILELQKKENILVGNFKRSISRQSMEVGLGWRRMGSLKRGGWGDRSILPPTPVS